MSLSPDQAAVKVLLTWAGLCVAESLFRVQSQADVPSVGRGWIRARTGPHVVSATTCG